MLELSSARHRSGATSCSKRWVTPKLLGGRSPPRRPFWPCGASRNVPPFPASAASVSSDEVVSVEVVERVVFGSESRCQIAACTARSGTSPRSMTRPPADAALYPDPRPCAICTALHRGRAGDSGRRQHPSPPNDQPVTYRHLPMIRVGRQPVRTRPRTESIVATVTPSKDPGS